MRWDYALYVKRIISRFIIFWLIAFGAVGIYNACHGYVPLSDKSLITLTAGVTINIFGAFLSIIKGLFPSGVSVEPEKNLGWIGKIYKRLCSSVRTSASD